MLRRPPHIYMTVVCFGFISDDPAGWHFGVILIAQRSCASERVDDLSIVRRVLFVFKWRASVVTSELALRLIIEQHGRVS